MKKEKEKKRIPDTYIKGNSEWNVACLICLNDTQNWLVGCIGEVLHKWLMIRILR